MLSGPSTEGKALGRYRLAWLLACVGLGAVVGGVGSALTGNDVWYLAIPVAVATGWLFVADPTQCEAPAARRQS